MLPILLHPMSRGYVKLKSKDPGEHPIIQPNYLAHPRDMKTLIEGMLSAGVCDKLECIPFSDFREHSVGSGCGIASC